MNWVDKPTKTGWYWFLMERRAPLKPELFIARVSVYRNEFSANITGLDGKSQYLSTKYNRGGLWCKIDDPVLPEVKEIENVD